MSYKYNIRTGVKKIKTKTALTLSGAVLGLAGLIMAVAIPLGAKAAVGGPVCDVPTDYPTIQAAVNDPGCSTINVASGTYNENVVIPRALTLMDLH
jgi:pectin methylesterase-like acyl-CoA thioesterase